MGCSQSDLKTKLKRQRKEVNSVYDEMMTLRKVLFQVIQLPLPDVVTLVSDVMFIYANSSIPKASLDSLITVYVGNLEFRIKKLAYLSKKISNFSADEEEIQFVKSSLSYYNIPNHDLNITSISLPEADQDETASEFSEIQSEVIV